MGRHGAAHFYPHIELMMGLPQLRGGPHSMPRSLAARRCVSRAKWCCTWFAAIFKTRTLRPVWRTRVMGWYISMATSRLRSPCKCGYVFSMHRVHVVVIVPMHPVRFLNEVCVCSRLDGCHVCGHHGAPETHTERELRALHRTGMFSLGVEVHQKKEILWSPRT